MMSSCWWHQHSFVVEFDEFSREKPVQWEEVFISKNSYHYVNRRLYNPSSLSRAVNLLINSGGQIIKSVTFFLTVSVVDEKNKKEKEGFVVMIVELFFLVSGCIQSSIQINNLDVWGFFFFFCVVTCFRWRKECFPTDQNSYQSPFVV